MEIYQVRITGTGRKGNHSVNIEKTFQVDLEEYKKAKTANDFRGQALEEYVKRVVPYHYPDVSIEPYSVSVYPSKKKLPKSPDAFEKFIAGVATGAIATKIAEPKKQKPERSQNNASNTNSFVKDLKKYSELNFSGKDENETKFLLNQIYNSIADYKWENTGQDEKENKIIKENNRVLNMCLRNYGVGLKYLQNISDNSVEIEEFSRLYKKIKRKKAMNTYGVIVIAISALIIILFILFLMGS